MSDVFQWDAELAIGVPQIDREHRHLIDLAAQMQAAMLKGAGKALLDELLDRLIAYTREHFLHEEDLMRGAEYPGLPQHVRQHDFLRTQVREMRMRASNGEVTMTIEVLQFLVEWIRQHIAVSDRKIAAYVVARPEFRVGALTRGDRASRTLLPR
ncbi:MAG: bacteriohemerythrin [Candidatus Solibacter sp.]